MNNKFDFKRFGQVLAKDWKNYFRNFGISLIVWVCLPILIWVVSLVFDIEIPNYSRTFFILAFVAATVMGVPARVYGKANLSRDGVRFAMLPATNTEKFLSMILFCSIITPIFCGLGCLIVDTLLTLMPFGGFNEYIELPSIEYLGYNLLFLAMLLITESSIFMLGNMIFKKRKTGKTVAWVLLILFVLTLVAQIPFVLNLIENITATVYGKAAYWLGIGILLVLSSCFNYLTYRKIKNQKY